jgi:alpha-acetolactate decarboxylase
MRGVELVHSDDNKPYSFNILDAVQPVFKEVCIDGVIVGATHPKQVSELAAAFKSNVLN